MLPAEASSYWRDQARVTAALLAVLRRLWRRMDGDFDQSWASISSPALVAVLQAQQATAERSALFVPEILGGLNISVDAEGVPDPQAFVGVAGDGRPVESLLVGARVAAKTAVAGGASENVALAEGGRWLEMAVRTLMSDTGRAVESTGVAAHRGVGYVRMLNPPACSRCVVLAGKFYRYNTGFRRHPGCDCRHIPARESMSGDLTVDADKYFASLPAAEQDRLFTKSGAQAIRDGADINQVVNVRRGMSTAQQNIAGWIPKGRLETAQVYGQQIETTTEGVTRRGVAYDAMSRAGYAQRKTDVRGDRYFQAKAPRLMPEGIYRIAENREDALRLLRLYGYLI